VTGMFDLGEYEFFLQIGQSFPFIEKLSLHNHESQQNDTEQRSMIKYLYLTKLYPVENHRFNVRRCTKTSKIKKLFSSCTNLFIFIFHLNKSSSKKNKKTFFYSLDCRKDHMETNKFECLCVCVYQARRSNAAYQKTVVND
jgi:hypothetical protein